MVARNTVADRDRGAKALAARLARAATVKVGILDDAPAAEPRGKTARYSLLEVAAVHEFGAPSATPPIPQRSFLRAGVDELAPQIKDAQRRLARRIVEGPLSTAQALEQLGAFVAGKLQARIAAGIAPPNAASTIARKHSSTPLVNTGQLRGAISWRVVGTPGSSNG